MIDRVNSERISRHGIFKNMVSFNQFLHGVFRVNMIVKPLNRMDEKKVL